MQVCHFYRWTPNDLRKLTVSEYSAAVAYIQEYVKESNRAR